MLITDIFQGVMGTQEEKQWLRSEVPMDQSSGVDVFLSLLRAVL